MLSCWVADGSRFCGHLGILLSSPENVFYLALVTAGAVVVRRTFHRGLGDAGRVCRQEEIFLDFSLLLGLGKGCWWWEIWAEERPWPAGIARIDSAWNTVQSPLLGSGKGCQLPSSCDGNCQGFVCKQLLLCTTGMPGEFLPENPPCLQSNQVTGWEGPIRGTRGEQERLQCYSLPVTSKRLYFLYV